MWPLNIRAPQGSVLTPLTFYSPLSYFIHYHGFKYLHAVNCHIYFHPGLFSEFQSCIVCIVNISEQTFKTELLHLPPKLLFLPVFSILVTGNLQLPASCLCQKHRTQPWLTSNLHWDLFSKRHFSRTAFRSTCFSPLMWSRSTPSPAQTATASSLHPHFQVIVGAKIGEISLTWP